MFTIIDPIQHIRSHPEMYLRAPAPDPQRLSARLASDAMLLGAKRVLTRHAGDWWSVSADVDWLTNSGHDPAELFANVVAFPEAGVNSMRSEVLLTAFAEAVATGTPAGICVVKGDGGAATAAAAAAIADVGPWARTVAFRLTPAPASQASDRYEPTAESTGITSGR